MTSPRDSQGDEYKLIPSEGQLLLGEDSLGRDESVRCQHAKQARRFAPFYLHGTLILLYSAIYLVFAIPTLRSAPNVGQEARPHQHHRKKDRSLFLILFDFLAKPYYSSFS